MFLGMKEMEKIIQSAPVEMQKVLKRTLDYNLEYGGDKKLLAKILSAMAVIDRKFFVEADDPYADGPLPIGKGQTISQPLVVAKMLLLSELKEGEDVLDVGAGSGWNASLAGYLAYPGKILSVDRIGGLVKQAEQNLASLKHYLEGKNPKEVRRLRKIKFLAENAFSGEQVWKEKFDKIIIAAGITGKETENKVEEMAKGLLKEGGLLICPQRIGPIFIYKKVREKIEKRETEECYTFVPLCTGMEE